MKIRIFGKSFRKVKCWLLNIECVIKMVFGGGYVFGKWFLLGMIMGKLLRFWV